MKRRRSDFESLRKELERHELCILAPCETCQRSAQEASAAEPTYRPRRLVFYSEDDGQKEGETSIGSGLKEVIAKTGPTTTSFEFSNLLVCPFETGKVNQIKGAVSLEFPQPFVMDQDGPSALWECGYVFSYGLEAACHCCYAPGFPWFLGGLTLFFVANMFVAFGGMLLTVLGGLCLLISTFVTWMSFLLPLLWIWRNPFPLKAYPRQVWVRQVVIWWLLASSVANAQGMGAYPIESIPITSGAAVGLWAPASVYETFLAEKWCQQFLLDQEHQSGVLGEEEELDRLHDEVDINPDLIKKAKVLSYLPGRITDVEEELELRDDAVPQGIACSGACSNQAYNCLD